MNAEELFKKKCHAHYYSKASVINEREFTEAFAEHDAEIIKMIREQIDKDDFDNKYEHYHNGWRNSLLLLKQKLEQK